MLLLFIGPMFILWMASPRLDFHRDWVWIIEVVLSPILGPFTVLYERFFAEKSNSIFYSADLGATPYFDIIVGVFLIGIFFLTCFQRFKGPIVKIVSLLVCVIWSLWGMFISGRFLAWM